MQSSSVPEVGDIQGLVVSGFAKHPNACYLQLAIADRVAAGRWLASVAVTTSARDKPFPKRILQVAFTNPGLIALGVPRAIHEQFSLEFRSGMAVEDDRDGRSRRLGDVCADAPENWEWGYSGADFPHVMLMLFAEEAIDAWCAEIKQEVQSNGLLFQRCLDTSNLNGREPFGFRDGISQPVLDWTGDRRVSEWGELNYTNKIALGEFVLGYPNEYGKFTDRPLLDDSNADLPHADEAEHRAKKDLGRNGTYLVFRRLEQDVRAFWRFLDAQAGGDAALRRKLAELMVGRRMDGTPLIGGNSADFTYESDPYGRECPFGAHIRRGNPRNGDLPYGSQGLFTRIIRFFGFGRSGVRGDLVASSRFHRILRRSREYGQGLVPEEALGAPPPEEGPRGLNFICLSANIARQFEFVQNAWIMSTKFDGLNDESDPILGNRKPGGGSSPTDVYTFREQSAPPHRMNRLPQFVTVRAGAYFFLPGLRALRYLANCGATPSVGPAHE